MAPIETLLNLRNVVRFAIAESDHPDPHVIADELAESFDEEVLRDALRQALYDLVRIENGRMRRTPVASRKWRDAAHAVDTQPDVFMDKYESAEVDDHGRRVWKFLKDFKRSDAEFQRDRHKELAQANQAKATQWNTLARRLTRGRVAADLGAAGLEKIFNV